MIHGVLVLIALSAAAADPRAEDQLRAEVERLVARLDAPQLAEREAAEAALLELGPEALDPLPRRTEQFSAEVRQRLARVRRKLQQTASATAAEASTVTLDAEDLPLSEALAAFERQTGNRIVDYRRRFGQPAPDPKLNPHFQQTPFWPALDRLLDRAGLTVYPYAEGGAIGIVSAGGRSARSGRACYSGPFRFEAVAVVARRDLLKKNARSLTVALEVAWEPRLRPIILAQRMADVSAVDRAGRRLPVADPQARFEAALGGGKSAVDLDLSFAPPAGNLEEIAVLEGKLSATLPGRIETFRFGDLPGAENVKQRIAAATVTLEEVRPSSHKAATTGRAEKAAGQTWEVRIRVRFDEAGDALESHRTWIFDNPAYLETPGGEPVAPRRHETIAQGEDEVGVAFFFTIDKPIDQYRFVYKTPGSIITRRYEYRLKNIPPP